MAEAKVAAPRANDDSPLPKLSPAEFSVYDHMAEHMNYFHNHFRQTWEILYSAACTGKRPLNMTARQFLSTGCQFCHQLEMHHDIEEQHIFPVLAKKMPAFQKELELLTQHKQIHAGLEQFQKFLEACLVGETELRMGEVKRIMDSFRGVLWAHLDDEVKQLRADNMRKYWTLEEMEKMPF